MNSSNPIPAASLVHETAWVHRLARQLVRDEHLAADVAQRCRLDADDPERRATERLRVHEVLTRAVRELPERGHGWMAGSPC